MARSTFGASLADFVVQPSDGLWAVAPGAAVTFYSDAEAGTQYTDLLDASSSPVTEVTADEFGMIPEFQGPDSVTGMWADAGGSSRAWIEARGGGAGGGSAAYTSVVRIVASATAPTDVRAAAQYLCDGTADQVQIQAAISDAQNEGGGIVMLSIGTFNLTAPIEINGTANEDDPQTLILQGCGEFSTIVKPATNVNGIAISNWAQCHLRDFGIVIHGSGSGIVSTAVTTTDTRSFWMSTFRNLRINGSYTPTNTGWAMDLEMPFRSVFDHIEIEGTRNGIHLVNDSEVQNAGDCVFSRMFIEIVGDDGVAIHIESIDGNMNQNNFSMVEAGANGEGCTGILIDGAAGGASQRFWGTNLEQFDVLVNVANGESNVFDLNYVTCRDGGGASNKAFVCGSNAYGNTFSAKWVNVASADSLKIIEDNNTTSNVPNQFNGIRIENNGGTVTYSKTASTVFRDITTFNDGGTIQAGLLQYPLSVVNNPSFTPADHGLTTWTQDPATCGAGDEALTAGVLYLMKVKVVDRSTLVTNVHVTISTAGSGLTSGQNLAGLYNSSGTLLSGSADLTTPFGSAGFKTIPLTAPQTLAVGTYYVGVLTNGTTPPRLLRGTSFSASGLNANLSTATARFLTSGTTQTALPSSVTLGSASTSGVARWAALS